MNCLYLDVRGIGVDAKVTWVKRLRIQHKSNFVGLQETQLLDFKKVNVSGC